MHILRIFSRPFESMYGPNERCHRPKPLISQPLRGNPVHSSSVEPNFGNSENTKYVL